MPFFEDRNNKKEIWLLLTTERSQHRSHWMCQQATFTTGLLSDFCKGQRRVTHLFLSFRILGQGHFTRERGERERGQLAQRGAKMAYYRKLAHHVENNFE